jgi:hypothetical protein
MKRANGFYLLSEINIFRRIIYVRFEVLTAVTMKNAEFRDVRPCNFIDFTDVLEERIASIFRAEE